MKNKLFLQYFRYYFLIALMPIIIFGLVYYFGSVRGKENELLAEHLVEVEQVLTKYDFSLQGMDAIAASFSSYVYNSFDLESYSLSIAEGNAIVTMLDNYEQQLGGDIASLFYEKGDTNIFTSEGKFPYSEFQKSMEKKVNLDALKFFTTINSTNTFTEKSIESVDNTIDNTNLNLFYFYPIPQYAMIPQYVLTFFLEKDVLKEMSEPFISLWAESLYIYSHEGALLANCNYKEDIINLLPNEIRRQNGVYKSTINEEDYYVFNITSERYSHNVIVLAKVSDVLKPYYIDLIQFSVLLFILLVLDFVLSFLLANVSYIPIHNLLQIMKNNSRIKGNAIEQIADNMNELLMRNNENEYRLEEQNHKLLAMTLTRLIRGQVVDESEIAYLNDNKEYLFPYKNFCIAILQVCGGDNIEVNSKKKAISEFLSKVKVNSLVHYYLDIGANDKGVLFINTNDTEVLFSLRRIYELINKCFVIDYEIAGGKFYSRFDDTNLSYLEAAVALQNTNGNAIRTFSEEQKSKLSFEILPSLKKRYSNSIRVNDIEGAFVVLEEIFVFIDKEAIITPIKQYLVLDLVSLVMSVASEIGFTLDSKLELMGVGYKDITKLKTLCIDCTNKFYVHMKKKDEEAKIENANQIVKYIYQNYRNPQMSLALLSEKFGKSISYLSKYIKNELGSSFVSCISDLRINWIKEQLLVTDLSIKEIIADSGYGDISSLMRKFKMVEGMTLTQYREFYKEKEL